MLAALSAILSSVISWVTDALSVITSNDFLLAFVILGVASMIIGITLTLVRGFRK